MTEAAAAGMIETELAWARPGDVGLRVLRLPAGVRLGELRDWLAQCEPELAARFDDPATTLRLWGEAVDGDYRLQAGDRVELCGGLLADPKSARRRRVMRKRKADQGP
jgi:Uncharacterized protein conserved in bacteria